MLDTLEQLSSWQNNSNLDEFEYIFGKELGTHLWNKFVYMKFNLLSFWCYLDKGNRKLLAEHIHNIVVSNKPD